MEIWKVVSRIPYPFMKSALKNLAACRARSSGDWKALIGRPVLPLVTLEVVEGARRTASVSGLSENFL